MAGTAFYQPSPPPQTDDLQATTTWLYGELVRIANVINEGRQSQLWLDATTVLPDRAISGVVRYFAAGVAGTKEGTYEFVGGTWTKL